MSHCLRDAAWARVFERNRAIPQKQHNCATFVASKLRVGDLRRLVNSHWFQLGRAAVGWCAAPQRRPAETTKHNTRMVGFFFFISNIQAAFTSKVWEIFHWLTLWQLTHNSQQHIHSLQWKVTEKRTACKYSIWKIYLGFNGQWFKSHVEMTHLGWTNLTQWSVCKAVGNTIRRLTVTIMNLYSSVYI